MSHKYLLILILCWPTASRSSSLRTETKKFSFRNFHDSINRHHSQGKLQRQEKNKNKDKNRGKLFVKSREKKRFQYNMLCELCLIWKYWKKRSSLPQENAPVSTVEVQRNDGVGLGFSGSAGSLQSKVNQ